jgi:hypothetical protein
MSEIIFENLTKKQKAFLCNGCGKKGGFHPPKFLHFNACDEHDVDYYIGNTKKHKKQADKKFLKFMLVEAKNATFFLRIFRYLQAQLYYRFVRIGGRKSFHYGIRRKNLKDLETDMMISRIHKLAKGN